MGLLCDYFVAPSDIAAAATLDLVGGPGAPGDDGRPAHPTVADTGIDPVVQMGTLRALLTGGDADDETPADAALVAGTDDGELLVVRLDPAVTAVLADASDVDLTAAAVPWSQTEEFWGEADPADLADVLVRVAALARAARADGTALYCWMSV